GDGSHAPTHPGNTSDRLITTTVVALQQCERNLTPDEDFLISRIRPYRNVAFSSPPRHPSPRKLCTRKCTRMSPRCTGSRTGKWSDTGLS
ncbi:uncharacterized protein PAN0_009c3660, partial [Moesziomyces antarcticus]